MTGRQEDGSAEPRPDEPTEGSEAEDSPAEAGRVEAEPGVEVEPAPQLEGGADADAEVEPDAELVAEPAEAPQDGSDAGHETGADVEPEAAVDAETESEDQPETAIGDASEPEDEVHVEPEDEPEPETEDELDGDVEPEPESAPDGDVEPETAADGDVEPEPESAPDGDIEPEPEVGPEDGPASEAGEGAAPVADLADEPESEPDTEPVADVAPEPAPQSEPEPEPAPLPPVAGTPLDAFPEQRRRRRWPRVLGAVASVLVVLTGLYVGALWLLSDRVPTGTVVAGVEIGGLDAAAAVVRLEEQLAAATTEPIPVALGDKRTAFDPVAAGLTLDAAATVDQLTGFGLEPARLWRHLFGADEVDPVTTVDSAALTDALVEVADSLVTDPVDGTIVFVDEEAQSTAAVDGSGVDEEAARGVLTEGWLTAPRPIELPSAVTAPAITDAEVERVLAEVARPLVDAPVAVAVADQVAELPTDVLAAAAAFVPDGTELTLQLDGVALVEAVTSRTTALLTDPADASFTFVDGLPVIVPGTPGTTLDPEALAAAVAVAGTGDDRTARVELVATDPSQSTAQLESLGIVQIVSEFSTPLTSEPRRTQNIIVGASKINGVLVRPGEEFSLTEALGPIDAEHGFVQAGAIVSGQHTDAWGGGLSQISTTTFNAAYFAGFELLEHTPHSEWFSRYPEGREATIFTGVIDLRWANNTPYGALLQAYVEGGRVHVKVWSTPHWTVDSTTSGRSGVVAPTTVYSQSPTCEAQSAGNPGFSVTVTRAVALAGVEASRESWTHRYRPQNRIVCGAEPTG